MGLLDDIIKGAAEAVNAVKNTIKEGENQISSTDNADFDTPPEALPPISVEANLNNRKVTFMISQDFIEDGGYESSVISLKYKPNGFHHYEDNCTISLHEGPGDFEEINECIQEYISNGSVSGVDNFTELNNDKYLFKAKMDASDYVEYFYVLRDKAIDTDEYNILLLFYPNDIKNTMLEKKLISCLDDVANSLTFLN